MPPSAKFLPLLTCQAFSLPAPSRMGYTAAGGVGLYCLMQLPARLPGDVWSMAPAQVARLACRIHCPLRTLTPPSSHCNRPPLSEQAHSPYQLARAFKLALQPGGLAWHGLQVLYLGVSDSPQAGHLAPCCGERERAVASAGGSLYCPRWAGGVLARTTGALPGVPADLHPGPWSGQISGITCAGSCIAGHCWPGFCILIHRLWTRFRPVPSSWAAAWCRLLCCGSIGRADAGAC